MKSWLGCTPTTHAGTRESSACGFVADMRWCGFNAVQKRFETLNGISGARLLLLLSSLTSMRQRSSYLPSYTSTLSYLNPFLHDRYEAS